MSELAPPLERAVHELSKLPSIGRKTAQRLVFYLLKAPRDEALALARAITELRERVRCCRDCFNVAEDELCPICADPKRERDLLFGKCLIERGSGYQWLSHEGVKLAVELGLLLGRFVPGLVGNLPGLGLGFGEYLLYHLFCIHSANIQYIRKVLVCST